MFQRASGLRWGIVRLGRWNGAELNLKNRWLGMQHAAGLFSEWQYCISLLSNSIIVVLDWDTLRSALNCSVFAWFSSIVYGFCPNSRDPKKENTNGWVWGCESQVSRFWAAGNSWNSHPLGTLNRLWILTHIRNRSGGFAEGLESAGCPASLSPGLGHW